MTTHSHRQFLGVLAPFAAPCVTPSHHHHCDTFSLSVPRYDTKGFEKALTCSEVVSLDDDGGDDDAEMVAGFDLNNTTQAGSFFSIVGMIGLIALCCCVLRCCARQRQRLRRRRILHRSAVPVDDEDLLRLRNRYEYHAARAESASLLGAAIA